MAVQQLTRVAGMTMYMQVHIISLHWLSGFLSGGGGPRGQFAPLERSVPPLESV